MAALVRDGGMMQELPILTTDLALKIERCFAPAEMAQASADGSQVVRFGRTIASKQFGPWPPSRVFCFNGDDVDRLDEILMFFGDIRPNFFLSPGGYTRTVAGALTGAGYRLADWKQAVLYGLPLTDAPVLPTAISIEKVTATTIDDFADVTAEGNGWSEQWSEPAKEGVRRSLGRKGVTLFLAHHDGTPAGVAELTIGGGTDNFCSLNAAAVLPRFRGMGIQNALLRHRLHLAHKQGCELAVGGADFGSASFRNQQRVGMRLAYVEATWKWAGQ
jgi:GNAT superfamily N-acetyltransferase